MNLCLCFSHLLKAVYVCEHAWHSFLDKDIGIWVYWCCIFFFLFFFLQHSKDNVWVLCLSCEKSHPLVWVHHHECSSVCSPSGAASTPASSVPLSHQSLMFICKDTTLQSTYWNDLNQVFLYKYEKMFCYSSLSTPMPMLKCVTSIVLTIGCIMEQFIQHCLCFLLPCATCSKLLQLSFMFDHLYQLTCAPFHRQNEN